MTNTSFSNTEIPLIPKALYGMRSFTVHDDGKLGPLHKLMDLRYEPGVCIAECDSDDMWEIQIGGATFKYAMNNPWKEDLHRVVKTPDLKCTCGFYAYFDGEDENPFMQINNGRRVHGIVRATGKCVVGSRGFRAEKMEIVGLVCDYDDLSRKEKFDAFVRDTGVGISKIPGKYYAAFALVYVSLAMSELWVGNVLLDIAQRSTTLFLYCFLFVQLFTLYYVGVLRRKEPLFAGIPSRQVANKIKKQYPDVEFFKSMDAARARFPLTKASELPT